MRRIAKRFLLLLLIGGWLTGCVSVSPWQRGTLAKASMSLDPHPMQSLVNKHTYGSREAASGGSSATGGGCGCY